ncbi:FxsA family protein [Litoreibacter roseus]|uniref:Membrane protein FxsA n=1 Tax=Litoreibacter roseus TaxID=2601869 RepID=A0A6N6JEB0_9RHOB|nr:FxsA family protein [Litoreibacter roseus]GFE64546.1 membrane protein FxsA [Litoreibacter roseus]
MWLFLLFVTIPIVEIALFIRVGGFIGLWPTLAIVVMTAFLGTVLVRAQGLAAIGQIKSNLNEFRDPTESLAHGAFILASGLLLLTPGFFTDAVGFALLVPPVRLALFHWLKARVKVATFEQAHARQQSRRPANRDIIDGEFEEVADDGRSDKADTPSGWTRH